jgi:transcriptional regulator
MRRKRRTKLTEQDIKEIRKLAKQGLKQKLIAPQFKISAAQISRILSGDVWAHV